MNNTAVTTLNVASSNMLMVTNTVMVMVVMVLVIHVDALF